MRRSMFFSGLGLLTGIGLVIACAMGQGPGGPGGPGPGGPGGPGPGGPGPGGPGGPILGSPYPGLTRSQLALFNAGLAQFLEVENVPGGLGPVFTESSCVKCHANGAPGGSGDRLVTRIGRVVNGQFDPMIAFGGPQIQDRGIGKFNGVNFVGEVVPPQATIVIKRRPIPLFGLGLVDAVQDETLIMLAQQEVLNNPLTAGRVSVSIDPETGLERVDRFGWKLQQPTVFAFAGDAYLNELGVTTPLNPNENCPQGNCALLAADPAPTNPNDLDNSAIEALASFITLLAPPPRGPVGATQQAGSVLFGQIGCTDCHTPALETGPSTIAALSQVTFSPYSDFLLHDMGTLGDGYPQNQAGPTEMRTAPLWGLRFETTFLHDGRAATVNAAILAHDGQAKASRNKFAALKATQQTSVLAFLNSL